MSDTNIYPYSSIGIRCTVVDNEVEISTSYVAPAVANNPAAGYGATLVDVFDSDGNWVTDAAGLQLKNLPMNILTSGGGTFVYTISPGLTTAGDYEAHPRYGVKTSGGVLDWRQQEIIYFTVTPNRNVTDNPVS
jgi:hypothetical protein